MRTTGWYRAVRATQQGGHTVHTSWQMFHVEHLLRGARVSRETFNGVSHLQQPANSSPKSCSRFLPDPVGLLGFTVTLQMFHVKHVVHKLSTGMNNLFMGGILLTQVCQLDPVILDTGKPS